MPSRSGPLVVVALCVAGVVATALAFVWRAERRPTAVVLISIDTLRADHVGAIAAATGTDGAADLTPHLDALAARGAVFTRAWTTAPLTVPAHASLLTGLVPPVHGLRTNSGAARIPPAETRRYPTVAEALHEQGWRTGAFVSASVLRADRTGLAAGFDVYDDVPAAAPGALHDAERRAEETVAAALAWLRGGSGSTFLWVHLFDPHAPYAAPQPWGAGAEHSADATGYAGEVRYVDHAVGLLLDGLAAAGYRNAAVVVVADHGEALGEHGEPTHGFLLHEATLHVPLLVAAPGLVAAGLVREDPVSIADVAPTLLGFADVPVPPGLGGRPLFAAGAPGERRAPYAESLYGWETARWAQVFALRDGDRKLVDAGPHTLEADLARDPRELAVTRRAVPSPGTPPADATAAAAERDVVESLRSVAALPPLDAPSAAAAPELAGGSYWAPAGTGATTILSRAENAALPSPYDRMDVVRELDAARALLAGGDPARAVTAFAAVVALDPANPQARQWLARARLGAGDPLGAAADFRAAFGLGWQDAACVAKALQASAAGVESDPEEAGRALKFLEEARGKGLRSDGPVYVFEALLLAAAGRTDAARRALAAARREPPTPWLEKAVRELGEALR